jgi:hypothetical protein
MREKVNTVIKNFEEAEKRGDLDAMIGIAFDEKTATENFGELLRESAAVLRKTSEKQEAKANGKIFRYSAGTHWTIWKHLKQLGATILVNDLQAAFSFRIQRQRIRQLENRLEALESAQAEFKYVGTHKRGSEYRKNNFVTHGGSLWTALRDTTQTPSQSGDWQLCVKRGKDGR